MARRFEPVSDPASGWNVWGQPRAIRELQQAVVHGPSHAWILAGPTGSGKHLAATSFAKALCCPDRRPERATPCGRCAVCRRIDRGVFPDVVEFSLARQASTEGSKSRNLTLNVSTVREVAASVSFRPSETRWKVIIVRDAETMQETAQEAFLKTLEEPPSYAVILLLTSDLEPILPTIQSRCVQVRFGQASAQHIAEALSAAGVKDERSSAISQLANGNVNWAFAAANDADVFLVRQQALSEAEVLVSGSTYDRLTTCIRMADEFARDRDGTFRSLFLVQQVWRRQLDGLLVSESNSANLDRAAEVIAAIRSIDRCVANLEANVRPRLAVEAMVAAWPPAVV